MYDDGKTQGATFSPPHSALWEKDKVTRMQKQILVMDSPVAAHEHLWSSLEKEGYGITVTSSVDEVLTYLGRKRFDIFVADMQLSHLNELDLFKLTKQIDPHIAMIILSETGTVSSVVNAIQAGVANYLQKPIETETLLRAIKKIYNERHILSESCLVPDEVIKSSSFCGIIGKNPRMQQIFELIQRIAYTDSTVFITGETGVGKELVARAIHLIGPRANMPFVAINCGALAETLLESELFGHEKGAFTGAHKNKVGKFEFAHKGTLFLDEIGDISLAMQVKLLRALQERKVEKVGGNSPIEVDVRIIAATNQNIKEKINRHEFRIDLFYRLNVIPIHVPPLRERVEDIPLLAQHFMTRLNKNSNSLRGIAPRAMRELMNYPWPGNIRELENTIERAYITSQGEMIERFVFPQYLENALPRDSIELVNTDIPFEVARSMVTRRFEKAYLSQALKRYGGNVSETAQRTGMNPRTLWRKINQYRLDRKNFKREE